MMDCCAQTQGPELGLLLRFLRGIAQAVWRAATFSYSDAAAGAVFTLTFLLVLVFQKGTPISGSQDRPAENLRRAA